jgi:hypothetical protein
MCHEFQREPIGILPLTCFHGHSAGIGTFVKRAGQVGAIEMSDSRGVYQKVPAMAAGLRHTLLPR